MSSILLGIFLIMFSISQYALNWVQGDRTYMVILGIVGLVVGVLFVIGDRVNLK